MGADTGGRTRRRHERRLGHVRRRAALASALGFAGFLALVGQHAVGSSKPATARTVTPPRVGNSTRYFDEQADGFAFDDGSAAPPPPPVAQTNVS